MGPVPVQQLDMDALRLLIPLQILILMLILYKPLNPSLPLLIRLMDELHGSHHTPTSL